MFLNIFVETDTFFSKFFNEKKVQKNSIYWKYKYFVTFEMSLMSLHQFNTSLLNKSSYLFQ